MTRQIACTAGLLLLAFVPGGQSPSSAPDTPAYTDDGNLAAPSGYREWIYLISGIDMSYAAQNSPPDHSISAATQNAELMGMEIHVKDHGAWGFYDLSDGGRIAKLIPRPASC